jgi:hypothetical protein
MKVHVLGGSRALQVVFVGSADQILGLEAHCFATRIINPVGLGNLYTGSQATHQVEIKWLVCLVNSVNTGPRRILVS